MEILEFVDVGMLQGSGVYMLTHRGKVVYVGRSKHLVVRLYQHQHAMRHPRQRYPGCPKAMTFDGIKVLPLPQSQLDYMERELIAFYKPVYNVQLKATAKADLSEIFPELRKPQLPLITRRL